MRARIISLLVFVAVWTAAVVRALDTTQVLPSTAFSVGRRPGAIAASGALGFAAGG